MIAIEEIAKIIPFFLLTSQLPIYLMQRKNINIANSSLCPVGVGYSEHLTYFLSPKGEMFGGFESYFCHIGSSLEEAFDNIFFKRNFQTLLE